MATKGKHTAARFQIEDASVKGRRCGQWDGQQCKATKDLTACAVEVKQGTILKVPAKVIVHLCPKHFQLERSPSRW